MSTRSPRLRLAHLPTPIVEPVRLGAAMGLELFVKRDDATGGAESGNKLRKLEFLFAEALARGADTVLTCGGLQSNHARATALVAAQLGLRARVFLRTSDPDLDPARAPLLGNVLLDRLAGAEVVLITPDDYRRRDELMAASARELEAAGRRPYVIPEGGSNGLGALGYVEAMAEVRAQLHDGAAGGRPFDLVAHACGSGGTAAGAALGAGHHGVAPEVRAFAVCDDAPTFEARIAAIVAEARALEPDLGPPARVVVDESARGPAYGVSTPAQRLRIAEAARLSGLVFDPVYTGKALSGLWDAAAAGTLPGKRVLFLHTGGLPGLLAQSEAFAAELAR